MSLDPITIELIQNKLTEIANEAGTALIRTAASPIVVEVKDLGFNIADPVGRTLVYSKWMPRHGTTLSFILKSCMGKFKEDGINPGDMILVNNPYDGALHALDLAVVSPVHFKDELIAWTGCATHHTDIRASRPAWSIDATDWFQEGIIFRPIKLVERGKLRQELFDFILDNVRVPLFTGLDLKSQIAANNVARQKIIELAERYGADTLKSCYDEMINFSEIKARDRIKILPEGRYEAIDYLDYDRLYTLKCTLIVKKNELTFDFTGTDPQAKSFINAAYPCSVANVHNVVICMLFPDLILNEGCFRPIKILIPDGTIFNCKPPAPCSGASTIGGWKAQGLTLKALSLALEKSKNWWRMSADWGSSWIHIQVNGLNQYGQPFISSGLHMGDMGGGARATKDGIDCGGIPCATTSTANIETLERKFPVLFLRRGLRTDSAGDGKYRGGLCAEIVLKPYKVNDMDALVAYTNKDIQPKGIAGGLPGAKAQIILKKQSNVRKLLQKRVPSFEEIEGDTRLFAQVNAPFKISEDDVLYSCPHSGGGFGDPLDREPALVYKDVIEGLISLEKAREVYKIVISLESMELDLKATEKLRRKARHKRPDKPLEE